MFLTTYQPFIAYKGLFSLFFNDFSTLYEF
jgi:hypothetical protein